jgi:hypothetical protein
MYIFEELLDMPSQFERLFFRFSKLDYRWVPDSWEGSPGESFSAIQHACHLRDIEIDGYQMRIKRTIEEEQPSLPSLDGYELARLRRYDQEEPESVLKAFRIARTETVATLQKIPSVEFARRANFAEYGCISLEGLVHLLRSHDLQHLACLEWLLAKRTNVAHD